MSQQARLTCLQKYAILMHCKAERIRGGYVRIKDVQCWALYHLCLAKPPLYSTIMRTESESLLYDGQSPSLFIFRPEGRTATIRNSATAVHW